MEQKHYMHTTPEGSSHSLTQQAWLEGIRVSVTDELSFKKNQSGHYHGCPTLREP